MGKTSSRSDETTNADRKFDKKVKFYEMVRTIVAQKSISKGKQQKKRSRQRKLKAYDLSSLSDYLPQLKAPSESKLAEFKLNCKSRHKLVLKEGNQLMTVVSHPVFQSNPLDAIYKHLLNTQPVTDDNSKKKDGKTEKRKAKKKKSKSSSQQSMEI